MKIVLGVLGAHSVVMDGNYRLRALRDVCARIRGDRLLHAMADSLRFVPAKVYFSEMNKEDLRMLFAVENS